ncbi:DUF4345 domain-containing protein [Rhodococcus sp. IEGM 1330]|uniref:DUF4345 domain-containing protein n=1 Tax=Rhodococcus sp. IEGM 1330 TaxID=3082225 RepID=UPI003988F09E
MIGLALIPIATGALGAAVGLYFGPGMSSERSDYFDSEYRFLNGVWITLGLTLLWAIRRPRERRQVVILVLVAILGGAVVRGVQSLVFGWPPLPFNIALVVEVCIVPVLTISFHRVSAAPTPEDVTKQ